MRQARTWSQRIFLPANHQGSTSHPLLFPRTDRLIRLLQYRLSCEGGGIEQAADHAVFMMQVALHVGLPEYDVFRGGQDGSGEARTIDIAVLKTGGDAIPAGTSPPYMLTRDVYNHSTDLLVPSLAVEPSLRSISAAAQNWTRWGWTVHIEWEYVPASLGEIAGAYLLWGMDVIDDVLPVELSKPPRI